jgi:transcriptional regulator with XRE-family HTH domain
MEFAERLREAMQREGLNASDVARRVWGEIQDKRGYYVARNRDRIGFYLAGVSFPEDENLRKLAEAVGLSYEALAVTKPSAGPSSSSTSGVGFGGSKRHGMLDTQLAILSNKRAVLALKREMKLDTALKIIELLKAEDEAEAGDGHDPAASPHSE